ncbi:MAG: TIR domain-containing protein [Anaerolineae bacterium]
MTRLFFGIITSLLSLIGFYLLWLLNPLYAFIAGITVIVLLIVGVGLIVNYRARQTQATDEDKAHRSGEIRRIRNDEKPEASWQTPENKQIDPSPSAPAPQTVPDPGDTREFLPGTIPVAPAPAMREQKRAEAPAREREQASAPDEENEQPWLEPTLDSEDDDQVDEDSSEVDEAIIDLDELEEFATDISDIEMPDWLKESIIGDVGSDHPPEEAPTEAPKPTPAPGKQVDQADGDFDLMTLIGDLSFEQQQQFFTMLSEIPIAEQDETHLISIYHQVINGQEHAQALHDVQFTAYYPRQAAANTTYGFYVYAHLPQALIEDNVQQFQRELGGRVPKAVNADTTAQLEEGVLLTAMLDCDQLHVNQVGVVQRWQAPFVRFDFQVRADETAIDEMLKGRVAIMLGMIEIATIDFQMLVIPPDPLAMVTAIPHNPTEVDHFESSATAELYQKIFISYSRKDTLIAEQYRRAQLMAGHIVFMDTHTIRAGEDWEVALKRFIDEADTFQLFWSQHAAASEHVKFEWAYALTQRCPETRCVHFIRPTYWEKPLPAIPDELNHLHFAFVDVTDQ